MIVGSALALTVLTAPFAPRMARHPGDVALGVVVALLSTAVPYFLELVALRLVRAATYGVLLSLEPAVAALTGFVIAGQTLSTLGVAAIATVMVAAAGASWSAVAHRRPPAPSDVGAPPL
jgi:inner membrane transporter RhtA